MSADYGEWRFYQNFEINPERLLSNVLKVHSDHVVEGGATAAMNLPQTGNSRLGFENPATMPKLIALELVRDRRSRANEGHLSSQDIDELRQFVQTARSKNAA